jgi:hypothetical protein
VILANSFPPPVVYALAYKVLDLYIGGPDRGWSELMLKELMTERERARLNETKVESDRVKGTSPSLALDKYAGTFENEMHGTTKIGFENGRLVIQIGPNYIGDLEHWNYDTFRVTWRDRYLGREFFTFRISRLGKVEAVSRENIAEFTRTP